MRLFALRILFVLLFTSVGMMADTVSLVGDKDCFGLGVSSCPDGSLWRDGLGGVFFTSHQQAGDPAFTDKWDASANVTYTQTYALSATATAAVLELRIAGIGDIQSGGGGPWGVLFNGTSIGQIPTNLDTNAFQEVKTYSFAVQAALLTGSDTITLQINNPSGGDGYSIDYSQLTVTESVPEPSIYGLLAINLGVLGAALRKRLARR